MAKALFGYIGAPDVTLAAEVGKLRKRVGELESEVSALRALNAHLAASSIDPELHPDLLALTAQEPAYT